MLYTGVCENDECKSDWRLVGILSAVCKPRAFANIPKVCFDGIQSSSISSCGQRHSPEMPEFSAFQGCGDHLRRPLAHKTMLPAFAGGAIMEDL